MDRGAETEEEAGSYGSCDGDERDVALLEAAVEVAVFVFRNEVSGVVILSRGSCDAIEGAVVLCDFDNRAVGFGLAGGSKAVLFSHIARRPASLPKFHCV